MSALVETLGDLWGERRRIGLVAVGVLWGTMSLCVLLAFGSAMVDATEETSDSFGVNLLRLDEGATTRPYAGLPAGRRVVLELEDAEVLVDAVPEVRAACVEYISSGTLEWRGERNNARVIGVDPPFGDMRVYRPQPGGRFLNERDEAERRRVVFLGNRLKEDVFGAAPAVGETVELWGAPFTVVGVLSPKITMTNYSGEDRDKAVIPASTLRDMRGRRNPSYVFVQLDSPGDVDAALGGIYRVLGARHRFDPADRDAVELQDYVAMRAMVDGILDGNRIFTVVVGVLGLLVSVVGVANAMVVLVEERTREIGVQRALGARSGHIASECLGEAVVVTLAGGVLGMLASGALLWGLNHAPLAPEARAYLGHPRVSLALGAAVVLLLALAGCVAGGWPARRAAALDPVEALREE